LSKAKDKCHSYFIKTMQKKHITASLFSHKTEITFLPITIEAWTKRKKRNLEAKDIIPRDRRIAEFREGHSIFPFPPRIPYQELT